jgi:hypothetical protein
MNDEEKLSKESLILLIIHDFNYEQQEAILESKKDEEFQEYYERLEKKLYGMTNVSIKKIVKNNNYTFD